jgi:hypothetical protein
LPPLSGSLVNSGGGGGFETLARATSQFAAFLSNFSFVLGEW